MDLFDTEEFEETSEFSSIPIPESISNNQTSRNTPARKYTAQQVVTPISVPPATSDISIDFSTYIKPINEPTEPSLLDSLSKSHYRNKINNLIEEIKMFDPEKVKQAVAKRNPYHFLKQRSGKPSGYIRMANLHRLFRKLIKENYVNQTFFYLTLKESEGTSDYILNYMKNTAFFGSLYGYVLFPKTRADFEECQTINQGILNLENLKNIVQDIKDEVDGEELMLVYSNFSMKTKNFDYALDEKLSKLCIAYSLFLAESLLAKDGNLVIKISNTYHPSTIELLYVIGQAFNDFCIVHPHSVPPHSFDQYVVCSGYKKTKFPGTVQLVKEIETLINTGRDTEHVLDYHKILEMTGFHEYLSTQNRLNNERLIFALEDILRYMKNPLAKEKQHRTKLCDECLLHWYLEIPAQEEEVKQAPKPSYKPRADPMSNPHIASMLGSKNQKVSELPKVLRKKNEAEIPLRTLDLEKVIDLKEEEKTGEEVLKIFSKKKRKK